MANEIIYKCHSINNKNVREGELKVLRKYEKELYFEFGEDEINIKKRFYDNAETLNKDYNELTKLKEKTEKEVVKEVVKEKEEPIKEKKAVEDNKKSIF